MQGDCRKNGSEAGALESFGQVAQGWEASDQGSLKEGETGRLDHDRRSSCMVGVGHKHGEGLALDRLGVSAGVQASVCIGLPA